MYLLSIALISSYFTWHLGVEILNKFNIRQSARFVIMTYFIVWIIVMMFYRAFCKLNRLILQITTPRVAPSRDGSGGTLPRAPPPPKPRLPCLAAGREEGGGGAPTSLLLSFPPSRPLLVAACPWRRRPFPAARGQIRTPGQRICPPWGGVRWWRRSRPSVVGRGAWPCAAWRC